MLKRTFDIFFSIIGILIIFPIMLLLFFIVIIESKGNAIYIQKRVGKDKRDFKLYKIRTMYINSDKHGQLTIGKNDSRITKTGAFLRKYKIDEFPQLINILIGDMSFVGPRPEVRKYVEMYNSEQQKVLSIRPGLTDFASLQYYDENEQLSKYDDPEQAYINIIMPHKLKLNLEYIGKKSFVEDIKIILRTFLKWMN
jgi:lipopolysaccharide/colanic/teichoic acid biosynthesis glycosyltransferase